MDTASEYGRINPQEFWSRFVQPRIAHIQSVSPLDSTKIVRDARQILDDELAAMHLAMRNLRTRRNALSPISSLPAEVLAHVFQIIVIASPPLEWSRPGHGWIPAMTHVCRHWRDIALLHPSLWGNINLDLNLPWRRLMMARAKFAPLTMNLPYYDSEESAFISEHVFHTRELNLAAPQVDLQETCQSLTSPALILESLELRSIGGKTLMLPSNIFAENTPLLRRITLQGVLFSWSGPIFRNLTHLRVSPPHGIPEPLTSEDRHLILTDPSFQYDQLFDAIARMPALQILNLAHCIPSRLHHNADRLPLNLPCLRLLSLAGMLTVCSDVVQHLTIPTSCSVILKCDTGGPQPIDGLVRFFDRHAVPCLRTLVILQTPAYTIHFHTVCMQLWRTYNTRDEPNGEPFISVRFLSSPSNLQSLESLCNVLPLDDLRELEISVSCYRNEWSSETWINMFGRCRNVERVSVHGQNVVHLCKALIRPWDRGAGNVRTAEQLFFRHLKSLEVSNADLLESTEDDGDGDQTPFNILFAAWLSHRRDLLDEHSGKSEKNTKDSIAASKDVLEGVDNRLERLQIKQCSILDEDVQRLGKVIQDVVWDYDEGIYTRDGEESEESEESEENDSMYDI